MYTTADIYPVSDFNRKTSEHIKRVQETKKPEVLTVNGKAAIVLIDPESYDEMAQNQELLQTLKNLIAANGQHTNGQSKPAEQVLQEFMKEINTKYRNANL